MQSRTSETQRTTGPTPVRGKTYHAFIVVLLTFAAIGLATLRTCTNRVDDKAMDPQNLARNAQPPVLASRTENGIVLIRAGTGTLSIPESHVLSVNPQGWVSVGLTYPGFMPLKDVVSAREDRIDFHLEYQPGTDGMGAKATPSPFGPRSWLFDDELQRGRLKVSKAPYPGLVKYQGNSALYFRSEHVSSSAPSGDSAPLFNCSPGAHPTPLPKRMCTAGFALNGSWSARVTFPIRALADWQDLVNRINRLFINYGAVE